MSFESDMEEGDFPHGSEEKLREAQIPLALEAISELENAENEKDEFFALSRAPIAYVIVGKMDKAKEAAKLFLELAEDFKDSWNYGNAIHNSNLVLGICAFDEGDIKAAKNYLENAGKTPGSPQLNSFGPNMQLAKRLLSVGEYESVLNYFNLCEKFWASGSEWLRIWKEKVSNKQIPKFYMRLYV